MKQDRSEAQTLSSIACMRRVRRRIHDTSSHMPAHLKAAHETVSLAPENLSATVRFSAISSRDCEARYAWQRATKYLDNSCTCGPAYSGKGAGNTVGPWCASPVQCCTAVAVEGRIARGTPWSILPSELAIAVLQTLQNSRSSFVTASDHKEKPPPPSPTPMRTAQQAC